jgi:hypothetical protein
MKQLSALSALLFIIFLLPTSTIAFTQEAPGPTLSIYATNNNYDQCSWRGGQIMPLYWRVDNISDRELIRVVKTISIINQAGTHAYVLPGGAFNLERKGIYYWRIPNNIKTDQYRLTFELVYPEPTPIQVIGPTVLIKTNER